MKCGDLTRMAWSGLLFPIALVSCALAFPPAVAAQSGDDCKLLPPEHVGEQSDAFPSVVASGSNEITLVSQYRLVGDCAEIVDSYVAGRVLFEDGTLRRIETGQLSDSESGMSAKRLHEEQVAGIQALGEDDLLDAAHVGYRRAPNGGLTQTIVGLWRGEGGRFVAAAKKDAAGPLSKQGNLLFSSAVVSAVDYIPAPDTPSGTLGLVVSVSDQEVWLLDYTWRHPAG